MGLSLSLSLSLSSHSADRPLPRQINGYMAYRKVVFADEQANGQTNGQMHARVRIGGFSAAKFIAPTYSRESTGGPGWNEGVEDIDYVYGSTMEQYFPLAHARASERANARHAGATQRRELVAKNGRRRRERRGKAKEQTLYSLLRHLSPYVLAFPCLQLFPSFCPVSPLFPSFQLCLLTPSLPTNGPTTNRRLYRPFSDTVRFTCICFRFRYARNVG